MGQQSNKVIKRRRRADYLKRKNEQSKLNGLVKRPAVKKVAAEKAPAAPAKKPATKKAPAKKAAKKVEEAVVETPVETAVESQVEATPETPVSEG